jgi:Sulfotransferase family
MNNLKKWPNLFVVGAAKAGTTSLHYYLSQHPEIYMSSVKEPHFFSQINPDPRFVALSGCIHVSNEESYLKLFEPGKDKKIRGEASPSYLWDEKTGDRIKQVSPEANIIIMLREPISRAYSHYLNDVRAGIEKRSFEKAIVEDFNNPVKGWGVSSLYVELSLYSEQVERYLNAFDRVLVIFFEEFIQDLNGELTKVFNFLEVDPSYVDKIEPEVMNAYVKPRNKLSELLFGNPSFRILSRALIPSGVRPFFKDFLFVKDKKPDMEPQSRQFLSDLYKDEADRLQAVLKRDIPWKTR